MQGIFLVEAEYVLDSGGYKYTLVEGVVGKRSFLFIGAAVITKIEV